MIRERRTVSNAYEFGVSNRRQQLDKYAFVCVRLTPVRSAIVLVCWDSVCRPQQSLGKWYGVRGAGSVWIGSSTSGRRPGLTISLYQRTLTSTRTNAHMHTGTHAHRQRQRQRQSILCTSNAIMAKSNIPEKGVMGKEVT